MRSKRLVPWKRETPLEVSKFYWRTTQQTCATMKARIKQPTSSASDAMPCSRCVWCRNKTSGGFVWSRHPEAVVCSISCVNLAEKSALRAIATLPKPCPNCGAINEGCPSWGSWKDGSGGCKRCNRRKEIFKRPTTNKNYYE